MILVVISVFFILIFISSRLREENLEYIYGLHGMYVRINSENLDPEQEKEELIRLLDSSFPGERGDQLQENRDIIISALEKEDADTRVTGENINNLIALYKTTLQYRDEVIDAFFFFLILAIALQGLIFTLSLKRVFTYRNQMAERERFLLQLQDVQEQERQDLAAYLHDNILQDMGALNLILTDERQRGMLQNCIKRIRKVSYSLVPVHLDNLGLDGALQELGDQLFTDSSCHFSLRRFAYSDEDIDNEKIQLLYRIARESLINVSKHSKASQIELIMTRLADKIILKIEDNGIGFLVDKKRRPTDKGGLGLFMVSLLGERLGADISIDSALGEGCRIKTIFYIKEEGTE